ncbi:hypothetical protein KFV08_07885 [Macrococcoides canis]|uniref:putative HNHc nuclease n=1 Tax=Macrococcoides canis TaxID=1855823 RepID=UPI00207CF18E|nr:putative HNHc nuclease [Macrococcus canis]MCO4095737.1 hypothetical protein [Macrococcus canis]UTH08446.1 hypothetical protein KFV08_07885 [Macrococcus canis]
MALVSKYQRNNKGTFDVVLRDVNIPQAALELLDNGMMLDAHFEVVDRTRVSDQQRKKIFALLNDIYDYTGQPQEDLRQTFQSYLQIMNNYNDISLSDCTRKIASELIELILAWIFSNNIPLSIKTSDLMKEDNNFLYQATINRKCVICGKPDADLAHRYAVGAGRDRRDVNHYGNEVLALCRTHHTEQHKLGIKTFNDKYHLSDSWIAVDHRLNRMLRGEKSE